MFGHACAHAQTSIFKMPCGIPITVRDRVWMSPLWYSPWRAKTAPLTPLTGVTVGEHRPALAPDGFPFFVVGSFLRSGDQVGRSAASRTAHRELLTCDPDTVSRPFIVELSTMTTMLAPAVSHRAGDRAMAPASASHDSSTHFLRAGCWRTASSASRLCGSETEAGGSAGPNQVRI